MSLHFLGPSLFNSLGARSLFLRITAHYPHRKFKITVDTDEVLLIVASRRVFEDALLRLGQDEVELQGRVDINLAPLDDMDSYSSSRLPITLKSSLHSRTSA